MKMLTTALKTFSVIAATTLAFAPSANAEIVFDFDSTEPGFAFPFSDGDNLGITTTFDGGGLVGEGLQVDVTSVTGAPAFAGFGFGPIDFADKLGVTPGNFTESDFDDLLLTFDYMVSAGLGLNSARFDTAGFDTRLEFPADLTSTTWETVSFSIADAIQLTEFVGALNGDAEGDATFQLSLTTGDDGVYAVGDQAKVDNFSLTFAAVPEPGSFALLACVIPGLALRRRR